MSLCALKASHFGAGSEALSGGQNLPLDHSTLLCHFPFDRAKVRQITSLSVGLNRKLHQINTLKDTSKVPL